MTTTTPGSPNRLSNPLDASLARLLSLRSAHIGTLADAIRQGRVSFPGSSLCLLGVPREQRSQVFRQWLGQGRLPSEWVDAMTMALRPNVTYVNFLRTPQDKIGTLYVERS